MTRAGAVLVAGALVAGLVGGCGGDDSGDLAGFCAAVDDLRRNDPFAELDVATPADMRSAFGELADGADRIADVAPGEARPQARRYSDSVDALRDELAGAGYVPTRVDPLRYGPAVASYTEAAVSVRNAAEANC